MCCLQEGRGLGLGLHIFHECLEKSVVDTFSTAGRQVISRSPVIRPTMPLEMVFANEGIVLGGGDDTFLLDLCTDDKDERADPSRESGVEEVTNSVEDGHELEIKTKCKVLPTPSNPMSAKTLELVAIFPTEPGARSA